MSITAERKTELVKQFAQKGLPVLKEHLKMAQSMKTAAN